MVYDDRRFRDNEKERHPQKQEEEAVIIDYLPNGYPLERRRMPVAQAIGTKYLTLLELVPRQGVRLQPKEIVYIGPNKRDKIYYIKGRLDKKKLTETAKEQLHEFVEDYVMNNEKKFVEFFNKADAVNKRLHQLELLPGFGKKHMDTVLSERKKGSFKSFDDIKQRVKGILDPKKAVEKKIIEELTEDVKFKLFVS